MAGDVRRRLWATGLGDLTTQPQRRNERQEVEEPGRPANSARLNDKKRIAIVIKSPEKAHRWIEV